MDTNSEKSNNNTNLNKNNTKYIIKLDNIYTKSRILFRIKNLIDNNIFTQSELLKKSIIMLSNKTIKISQYHYYSKHRIVFCKL